jgi:hypothetical protein
MALLETLTVGVGGAISKALIKRWAADSEIASDVGGQLAELLAKAGLDYRESARTVRRRRALADCPRISESRH